MNLDQKKAWLYRYQDSLHRQEWLLSQLEEAHSRATSIQAAPGGIHTAPPLAYTLTMWALLCSVSTSCSVSILPR